MPIAPTNQNCSVNIPIISDAITITKPNARGALNKGSSILKIVTIRNMLSYNN